MHRFDVPLFDGIEENSCERMFACFQMQEESYAPDQLVLRRDRRHSGQLGVLLEGSILVTRIGRDGSRTVLEYLEKGDIFGEGIAFCRSQGDCVTVNCLAACRVLFIDYESIAKRCENACLHHSRLVRNAMSLVAEKSARLSKRVEILSGRSIRDKLMRYFELLCSAQKDGSGKIPFGMGDLADFLCVDRSALSRELSRMKREGLVEIERRRVKISTNGLHDIHNM